MPRVLDERLSERAKRIGQSLAVMEASGKTGTRYASLLSELGQIAEQIRELKDCAELALENAISDAERIRTKTALHRERFEERQKLADAEIERRQAEMDELEKTLRQQARELQSERQQAREDDDRAKQARLEYERAMAIIDSARVK